MKKYWPVLSLALISLIGLSIYYIDMAKALSFEHDFTFETLAGDEQHLQHVVFETGYQQQRDYRTYYVQQDNAQLVQDKDFYYTSNYDMLQLLKEHKSFFRAKLLSGRHLYNDVETIAHVYIDDQYYYDNPTQSLYKVALYDKQSKQQQKYELIADVETEHHWQTIEWVYAKDKELKTLSVRNEKNSKQSVILTTFDLQNETVEETVLFTTSELQNVRFNHSSMTYNSSSYALIETYNYNANDTSKTEALYVFNAQTKQVTTVAKPETLTNLAYSIEEDKIIAYSKNNDTVAIALYDIRAGSWQQPIAISLHETPLSDSFQVQLKGDKLYVLYQLKEAVITTIADLNGNVLYTGKLTVDDVEGEHSLYVHRVYEQ